MSFLGTGYRRCGRIVRAGTFAFCALVMACELGEPAERRVDVSDPAGDAVPVSDSGNSPDLLTSSASLDDSRLAFTFLFVGGTFDPRTHRIGVWIDSDLNRSTGTLPGDTLMGLEYRIDVANSRLTIHSCPRMQNSTCDTPLQIGPANVVAVGQGPDITAIYLSPTLLSEDGRVNFRVTTMLGDAVVDYLPDLRLTPARLR
jgi:hypothetical protein